MIGKVSLAKEILEKPSSLTRVERKEIERHPLVGYRLLNLWENTMGLADLALQHHERWDGTGYPQGIQGNGINPLAQIIALAESWDVMINDWPYNKGMSKDQAILEIENNAGSQFDPNLAEILLKIVTEEE